MSWVIETIERWMSGKYHAVEELPYPSKLDCEMALKIAKKMAVAYDEHSDVAVDADGGINLYYFKDDIKIMFLIYDGSWAYSLKYPDGKYKVSGDFYVI